MTKRIQTAITRETPDVDPMYRETLMIRIEPGSKCLEIWQKRRRGSFLVRFADIFRLGFQSAVDLKFREKFSAKGKRRRQRRV